MIRLVAALALAAGCSGTATGEGKADAGAVPDPLAALLDEPSKKLRSRGYTEQPAGLP